MSNFIINNDIVALMKNNNKTILINVDNYQVINKNIKKIIDLNCLLHGSSLEGRIKYVKSLIGNIYKCPVYINSDIILVPINSVRSKECLFINYNKILNYKLKKNYLILRCVGNNFFKIDSSKYSLERLIINAIKINNNINDNSNICV